MIGATEMALLEIKMDAEQIEKIIDERMKLYVEQIQNETATEIYIQLQGHGTTYVKKWIKNKYGVEVE